MKNKNSSIRQLFFFLSLLGILVSDGFSPAIAENAFLVKDINSTFLPAGSAPHDFFRIGPNIYFAASNPFGTELWKTDGTSEGTTFIKDISPGSPSSRPKEFIDVNGTLFFVADDISQNVRDGLWKSDGTEAGTVLVNDLGPSQISGVVLLDVINGILIFLANDGIHGMELWRSDGTSEGTFMIKDIDPGINGFQPQEKFARVNNILIFGAHDKPHGKELWRTDGTPEGTFMLKDIYPDADTGGNGFDSNPSEFTLSNGTLYFRARSSFSAFGLWKTDGTSANTIAVNTVVNPAYLEDVNGTLFFNGQSFSLGFELYKSDGTHAGTEMVKDINQTVNQFGVRQSSNPHYLTNVNGTLFFIATDGIHGHELWKSDGTEAGTILVKDIKPGSEGSNIDPSTSGQFLTAANGRLFLKANDGVHGPEVWSSDGTEGGTFMLRDILPGSEGSFTRQFTSAAGKLFFTAINDDNGKELWVSDGTPAGTFIRDISPGPSPSNPDALKEINGLLYFNATDYRGKELWRSDGTPEGTTLVADLNIKSPMSNPFFLADVGGTLFFLADDGIHGRELWKSDGTENGTNLVINLAPDNQGGYISKLTAGNENLFFQGMDGTLWKSNGTEEGTIQVKDIFLGFGFSFPQPAFVNNLLYFVGDDSIHGGELWKSDGTEVGTVLVKDIFSGEESSIPNDWTEVNGVVFFTADDGIHGRELWKTDGTEEGTILVSDIYTGIDSSDPSELINFNGTLYFVAKDGVHGIHGGDLWKSDGTEAGTVLVRDFNPLTLHASPSYLTVINGTLFLAADDGNNTVLWNSDGTENGTVMVKAISASRLTAVNNTLFFTSYGTTSDFELWKSDGTEAGTVLVKNIRPGVDSNGNQLSSSPSDLVNANGLLFFSANDGIHEWEPWISDGTEEGTIMLQDIHPVPGQNYLLLYPTVAGNNLFFNADNGTLGRELWALDLTDSDGNGIIDVLEPHGNDVVTNLLSNVSVHFNDNSSSAALHPDTASAIATADIDSNGEDDIVVSFSAGTGPDSNGGTYISRNQGALISLDTKTAEQITSGDVDGNGQDDLLLDFGVDGFSLWVNDTSLIPFIPLDADAMASGDIDNNGQDDMVLSFPGVGTFTFKNFADFVILDSSTAETLQVADVDNNGEDDVIVSFPAGTGPDSNGGTYISRNQGALMSLDTRTAEQIAVGDLNANGQEDLLLDFGVDGLNLWVDDSFAVPFIPLDPTALASGDLDNNGQDDMVMSFPGVGTISLKNFTTIDVLDAAVAQDLAVGAIDGN